MEIGKCLKARSIFRYFVLLLFNISELLMLPKKNLITPIELRLFRLSTYSHKIEHPVQLNLSELMLNDSRVKANLKEKHSEATQK